VGGVLADSVGVLGPGGLLFFIIWSMGLVWGFGGGRGGGEGETLILCGLLGGSYSGWLIVRYVQHQFIKLVRHVSHWHMG